MNYIICQFEEVQTYVLKEFMNVCDGLDKKNIDMADKICF